MAEWIIEPIQIHIDKDSPLKAVYEATKMLTAELSLEAVLHRLVKSAQELTKAQYGALGILDENEEMSHFVTVGITPEERKLIGELPKGRGILGVMLKEGKPLRLDDLTKDLRACGFPPNHPPMKSFLGVPIILKGKTLGSLYLTNKEGSVPFSEEDEGLIETFASGVAVVIENARLYEETKKQAEKLLQLASAIESLSVCVAIVDLNGNILYVNPAYEKTFGYAPKELIGRNYRIFYTESYALDLIKNIYESTLTRGDWEGEILKRKKNGEVFPTYTKTSLVKDKDGNPIAIVGITEDITERKALQEQLIQSEKMAALGQLVSGVAHELNNPLTAVIGYSQLIAIKSDLSEKTKKDYLDNIASQGERAKRIIQNLLSFARQHKPEREPIIINQILEKALSLRAYDFKVRNIEIIKDFAPDIPITFADLNQLQQVFLNIVTNAEQAMTEAHGRGKLVIRTRFQSEGNGIDKSEDGIIEISFSDDGPGIPKENLKRVFDPFFTIKPVGKGTGLGLSISYGIVKDHGGEIYALSEEGKGATFIIELPILKEQIAEEKREEEPSTDAHRIEQERKVLIVEDEELITKMLEDIS